METAMHVPPVLRTVLSTILIFVAFNDLDAGAPPYKSPEDVFAAAKKAAEKEDMKTFMSCLPEDSRDIMAGGMVVVGIFIKALAALDNEETKELVAALDATLKKHGITEETLAKMKGGTPIGLKDTEAMRKALKSMVAPIKDRSAFVGDMVKVLQRMDKGKKEDTGFLSKDSELKELKIENGKAKGVVVSKQGGQEKRDPIEFRRVRESWLIELPIDSFASPLQPKKSGG
jgi:hypothetical protein